VVEGDFRQRSGTEAVRTHPPSAAGYTAVFALNDLMAFGVVQALRDAGFAVPTDVSVVGYDDVPTASLLTPGLTTVRQPTAAIGRRAALRLLDRITGVVTPDPVERVVLPVELRVRASTASV
jgi:LacI family transcriptional regulator